MYKQLTITYTPLTAHSPIYSSYHKDALTKLVKPFYDLLTSHDVAFVDAQGKKIVPPDFLRSAGTTFKKIYQFSKEDLIRLIELFLTNASNFKVYYDSLSLGVQQTFRFMAYNLWIGASEINNMVGHGTISRKASWYSTSIHRETPFDICRVYGDLKGYLYQDNINIAYLALPADYRKSIIDIFTPDFNRSPSCTDELPDAATLATFTGAPLTSTCLEILTALFRTDQLQIGRSKLLSVKMMKDICVQLPMTNPKQWDGIDILNGWVPQSIALLFAAFVDRRISSLNEKGPKILKDIFSRLEYLLSEHTQLFAMLLPHISGFSNTIVSATAIGPLKEAFVTLFKEAQTKWIDITEFKHNFLYQQGLDADIVPLMAPNTYSSTQRMQLTVKADNTAVRPDNVYDLCGKPLIDGMLMLLAAFGYLEVAIDANPHPHRDGSMPEVKYARLTPIGQYALGITQKLELEKGQTIQKFEVDPNRLIIRILDGPALYNNWIMSIADPIGGQRFVVSEAKVLKRCSTVSEIDDVEKFLHANICEKPGKVWDEFFERLRSKANAVTHSRTDFETFDIDPNDRELHQLLTTEPRLREHVRRAEGFIVLVERTYCPLFKSILRDHGYLM